MIDDALVGGTDQAEHDERLRIALQRISDAGMTLNPRKCQFSTDSLSFLGVRIQNGLITPDPGKVFWYWKANFPVPKCVSSLRRFLGMVNQLGKFSPRVAELTELLRVLLSKKSSWVWDSPQQSAFEGIVTELSQAPALLPYSTRYDTKVSADASAYGIGAVLFQRRSPAADWQPVSCASRSLSPAELNYAQIEKEALALTWGCERFSHYLLGFAGIQHRDGPQAIGSTLQYEAAVLPASSNPTLSAAHGQVCLRCYSCAWQISVFRRRLVTGSRTVFRQSPSCRH